MITQHAMRRARIALPLLAITAFTAACGTSTPTAQNHQSKTAINPAGPAGASVLVSNGHLADSTGRTVYLWVADTPTTSHCAGACASVWPPETITGQPTPGPGLSASELTTVKRSDGATQLAYAGHPLYYFTADTTPGDTKGQGSDGFGAKWWELNSSGQPITTTAATPTTPNHPTITTTSSRGYGY